MEGMETRLSESEEKYNKLFEKMTNISEEKESLEKFIALAEASDGLTDTQSEKLETLAEGLSFTDIKGYKNKLLAIKENYFSEETVEIEDETVNLEENVEVEDDTIVSLDEGVNSYVAALGRTAK